MNGGAPTTDMLEPDPRATSEPGLARAAVGGVAWQGLSYLLGKVLVLASTVVLARLLTPGDFGLVGLALVFIVYVEVATDLGVAQALIYLPPDRRQTDAAVAVSLLVSAAMVAAAMVSAPAVAGFFGRPEVTPIFRAMSLSLLLGGSGQVPDALLRKDFRFRQRILADLGRSFFQGVTSIALAVAGLGPWAIVYGYLAGGLAWTSILWWLVDYRPGVGILRLHRPVVWPLLAYGAPAAANGLLLSLVFDIDYLIVGRRLGAEALGYYTLGFRIPEMIIINVFYVLSSVAFPVLSRARSDPGRLRRGYLTVVRLQSVYGAGAGIGLAMVAPMLVDVVFGPRWIPTVVPLQALALYAAFRSLGIGAIDVYKAMGRPALAFVLSVARLAVLVPVLLYATRFGIDGVSWAQAFVALALAMLMQAVASKVLAVPAARLVAALAPAVAVGLGVAVGAGAVRLWVPGPDGARLLLAVAAGAAAGLGALHLADRGFLGEIRTLVRPSSRRADRSSPQALGGVGAPPP